MEGWLHSLSAICGRRHVGRTDGEQQRELPTMLKRSGQGEELSGVGCSRSRKNGVCGGQ